MNAKNNKRPARCFNNHSISHKAGSYVYITFAYSQTPPAPVLGSLWVCDCQCVAFLQQATLETCSGVAKWASGVGNGLGMPYCTGIAFQMVLTRVVMHYRFGCWSAHRARIRACPSCTPSRRGEPEGARRQRQEIAGISWKYKAGFRRHRHSGSRGPSALDLFCQSEVESMSA